MTAHTLRELCASYIDGCETYMRTHDDMDRYAVRVYGLALGDALGMSQSEGAIRAILAALDAERAAYEQRGRAEIFGLLLAEFKRESQSATDRARYSSDERKEGYAMAMQDVVRTIRSRAGMVGADSDDRSAWEALVASHMEAE